MDQLKQSVNELIHVIEEPVLNNQAKMEDYEEIVTSIQMLYQQYIIINAEVM